MPYTGTTPYTAQDFAPGQKALAQDITNMSYALARLDQNATGAYCVKTKADGTDNQSIASGAGSAAITCKTLLADPLGSMNLSDTAIQVPFDGLWLVSGYCYISSGSTTGGLFFRPNGNAGGNVVWGSTTSAKANVSAALVIPLSAGDYLEMCYVNNGVAVTCQKAIFSLSLLH